MANGEDADVVEQAADVRTAERQPFQPIPIPVEREPFEPVPIPTEREPFKPVEAARKPFQPVIAQPAAPAVAQDTGRQPFQPLGSPAEAAAAQQGWQWASAGGGAPRAELVKLPPLSPAGVAAGQAQAFALNQQAGAQARDAALAQARDTVNSPPGLLELGSDLSHKVLGNFESLYGLPVLEGADTDHLTVDNAVKDMVPTPAGVHKDAVVTGTPIGDTRDALKADLIRADPATRANMLAAYTPYATVDPITGALKSVDTAALNDSLDRLGDADLQASKAQTRAAFRAKVAADLAGDPRLQGTRIGNIINQVAALPAYASAANPLIAPVGLPLIFGRVFADSRQQAAELHPDWNDEQLDHAAASAAIIQTVGSEAGGRIIGAGLGPLLRNLRGNYLTRALIQAPATAVAQAGVGAGTQLATNIALGQPVGEGIVEAALGQGLVGAAAGAVHAIPRPPLAPEVARPVPAPAAAPEITTGPSGARIRGPTEATLETPPPAPPTTEVAPAPPTTEAPPPPPTTEVPPPVPPIAERPLPVTEPVRPLAEPVPEPAPPAPPVTEAPAVSVTREDVARRAYEISEQRGRAGQPGDMLSDWAQAQQELSRATEPILPATVSEAEPINSAIANRYVQERMASGELGQIDPSQGRSTEDMVRQGLQMSPNQRDGLIDNFIRGKGGDLDQQGAAIRSKEALLSEQSRAASRAATANPANPQLQAQAKAASDAVTAFHNGPIKKFKRIWSDSGRALQREIPLDYTTFNGMKEAYLKGNGKEAPPGLEPKLKRMAEVVSKTADAERVAVNNYGKEIGKEIGKRTRGKTMPTDDQVRTRLMDIMKDLPCRT
jgi:hypothetical protein